MSGIIDLRSTSGLDLELDSASGRLIFGKGIAAPPQPAIRSISEMKEVLMDPALTEPEELYYMYRDVHVIDDQPRLKKYNLRYDVTAIRPERLGREMMKTAGHYHPGDFGELYEVLEGTALCLLQKHAADWHLIEEVILVQAKAGQKIVIPPGFGHILVNPGPGALVTSNWVSSVFSSEYELYKKAGGAAYFLTGGELAGRIEFISNPFFKQTPRIKFCQPAKKIERFGLKEASPIYNIIRDDPLKLDFLNRPKQYDYRDVFVEVEKISPVCR